MGIESRRKESQEEQRECGSPATAVSCRRQRVSWAQLLMRVFFIDALTCPKCGVAMKVLAFLTDPEVVRKILRYLELPDQPPPLAPARLPVDLFYIDDGGWTCEEEVPVAQSVRVAPTSEGERSRCGTGRDPPLHDELA